MFKRIKNLVVFSLPLVGLQLAEFALGITDNIMLGNYDPVALGSVTIAISIIILALLLAFGFLIPLPSILSQAKGAENPKLMQRTARMGILCALALAVLTFGTIRACTEILPLLGFDDTTVMQARTYLNIRGWDMFPIVLALPFRGILQVHKQLFFPTLITVMMIPANLLFNWMFIYGNFGFSEMGIAGSAYATVLTNMLAFVGIFTVLVLKNRKWQYALFRNMHKPDWEILRHISRIGIPCAVAVFLEASVLTSASFLMGGFSFESLSAHAILLNITMVIWCVSFGLGMSTAILVGEQAGRKDMNAIKTICVTALWTTVLYAVFIIVLFAGADRFIIEFFLKPGEAMSELVATITLAFLPIMIFSALSDSFQTVLANLLRGMNIQDGLPLVYLIGCYGVGFSTIYILKEVYDLGLMAVWIGLASGFAVTTLVMGLYLIKALRNPNALKRVKTD